MVLRNQKINNIYFIQYTSNYFYIKTKNSYRLQHFDNSITLSVLHKAIPHCILSFVEFYSSSWGFTPTRKRKDAFIWARKQHCQQDLFDLSPFAFLLFFLFLCAWLVQPANSSFFLLAHCARVCLLRLIDYPENINMSCWCPFHRNSSNIRRAMALNYI